MNLRELQKMRAALEALPEAPSADDLAERLGRYAAQCERTGNVDALASFIRSSDIGAARASLVVYAAALHAGVSEAFLRSVEARVGGVNMHDVDAILAGAIDG